MPPKQAAGKAHCSNANLLLWHLDHPKEGSRLCASTLPLQTAPGGHVAHDQVLGLVEVLLRYLSSSQKRHVDFDKKDPGSHRQSVGEVEPGGAVEEAWHLLQVI